MMLGNYTMMPRLVATTCLGIMMQSFIVPYTPSSGDSYRVHGMCVQPCGHVGLVSDQAVQHDMMDVLPVAFPHGWPWGGDGVRMQCRGVYVSVHPVLTAARW